ncbi:MAG: MarR family winged helix-turn-helix transcriptional regulator [Pirellulales bacterium]
MSFEDSAKRVAKQCLSLRMRILDRTLTSFFDDAFRPLGITAGQFHILLYAANSGRVLPREMCATLHMDKSTASRNLDRMEVQGWIVHVKERDARTQPFELTKQGTAILEKAFPLWEAAQEQAVDSVRRDGDRAVARHGQETRAARCATRQPKPA